MLHIYSPNAHNRPIQGVRTLCRHSYDGSSLTTSREALKCLANVLLLEAKTRQIFVNLGYPVKAADRLKVDLLLIYKNDPVLIDCS